MLYDYKAAKTVPLGERPWLLEQFRKTWELQEERRGQVAEKARWFEEKVAVVERGTWDKVGAVEDMGGKT